MAIWLLVVYALAVCRLTGLITTDAITARPRDAITARLDNQRVDPDDHHWLTTLITCSWCASIWLAAVVAPLAWWYGTHLWLLIPAIGLSFSFAAGALSGIGRS